MAKLCRSHVTALSKVTQQLSYRQTMSNVQLILSEENNINKVSKMSKTIKVVMSRVYEYSLEELSAMKNKNETIEEVAIRATKVDATIDFESGIVCFSEDDFRFDVVL